jgi:hypothetical protein
VDQWIGLLFVAGHRNPRTAGFTTTIKTPFVNSQFIINLVSRQKKAKILANIKKEKVN